MALVLDFDGTLAPFVPKHDKAILPKPLAKLLRSLNAVAKCHIMILSGRQLADVRSRAKIPSIFYGGNHGLEMEGPGFSFIHPKAHILKTQIPALVDIAQKAFTGLPGVSVENKNLSLTVHFRRLLPQHRNEFKARLEKLKSKLKNRSYYWRAGDSIWELLPRVQWNKGRAALLFLEHLRNPFVIGVGDDVTDEDLFKAIKKRGISLRTVVGGPSQADYCIEQKDMDRFLNAVCDLLTTTPGGKYG